MNKNSVGIHPFGHDSALVTIREKKNHLIIYAEATERITRQKHDVKPVFSLKYFSNLLKNSENIIISNQESKSLQINMFNIQSFLDKFYFYKFKKTNIRKTFFKFLRSSSGYLFNKINKYYPSDDLNKYLKDKFGKDKNISQIQHHLAHALTAYHTCPDSWEEKDILCVTIDGQGDKLCGSVHSVEKGILNELITIDSRASLCIIYAYATKCLGFVPNADEGKLEALACYAKNPKKILYDDLLKTFNINKKNLNIEVDENRYKEILRYLKNKRYLKYLSCEELAWNMQQFFEDFYSDWVEKIADKYHKRKIALAGGGAANVKLNRRIFESDKIQDIHIFPAMGDDGVAFGAAIFPLIGRKSLKSLRNIGIPYWGYKISNKSAENIASYLDPKDFKVNKYSQKKLSKIIADKISIGQIGSICCGAAEFGPRALGNRSIIASPTKNEIREKINKVFKKREWFQPFCPIIAIEECPKYLKNWYLNKHMTCAFPVKDCAFKEIPSCVHIDGTSRVQVLTKDDNVLINLILEELNLIGHPKVLLNTSFNLHGRSIVRTANDGVQDFLDCDLDFMLLGNIFIERKR